MPQRLFEKCTVGGCGRKHKAAGYCATHYAQHRRGFPLTAIKPRDRHHGPSCSEEGCASPVKAHGLCKMHYARQLRHGHVKYRDRKKPQKPCTVAGCTNHTYTRSMCNPHYLRSREAKQYGLTLEEIIAKAAAQDDKCAICRKASVAVNSISGKVVDLHIDHCHETGKFRGLICAHCNRGLGLFGDSPETLRAALAYLESFAMS